MAHRVNISVSVPDDLYKDVVLPAKNSHVLAELVCSCLELYSRSAPVKEYIDTGAQAKADSEWDDVLDSLNAAVGALDNDVSFLGDSLEAGKSKVAEEGSVRGASGGEGSVDGASLGYSGASGDGIAKESSEEIRRVSEKVDSLEEGFGSLKSMIEDALGYMKSMSSEGSKTEGAGRVGGASRAARGASASPVSGFPVASKPVENKSFEVEDESVEAVPVEQNAGEDGESQVSGYSVVQDLKPGSVNIRNYDTEEEPRKPQEEKTQEGKPARIDPQAASLISQMADSLGADMFI
jgi:hypothetical protein